MKYPIGTLFTPKEHGPNHSWRILNYKGDKFKAIDHRGGEYWFLISSDPIFQSPNSYDIVYPKLNNFRSLYEKLLV